MGAGVGEARLLLDAPLHLELHLRVGTDRRERVQKLLDVHLLLGGEVVGHGEGLRLESGLQAVGLVAEGPPLVAAALELVLDHHGEGRGLRLGLALLLRPRGAEAQLGCGGVFPGLLLRVRGARLIRGVHGRMGSGAGVRGWPLRALAALQRLMVRGRVSPPAGDAAAADGAAAAAGGAGGAALLRLGERQRGDAHDLGDHVEERLGAAGRSLRCLHVEAARVGERGGGVGVLGALAGVERKFRVGRLGF